MKRTPLRRKASIKRVNKGRRKAEWARAYGCKARVEFVKRLPCAVETCCKPQLCENAHVKSGGKGRKADAEWVVPLCRQHHRQLHHNGIETFQKFYNIDLDAEAVNTNAAWASHCTALGMDPSTGEPRTEGADA